MPLLDRRALAHFNWTLFLFLLLLSGVGILNLYSAGSLRLDKGVTTTYFYQKQIYWLALGMVTIPVMIFFDYRHLKGVVWPMYGLTLILLAYVLFFGVSISGARRWIDLGAVSFQPTELAKVSVILLCAALLARIPGPVGWSGLAKVLLLVAIPVGFILLQPDLGSGLNILMLAGGMLLFKGLHRRILATCLAGIPVIAPATWFLLLDYQKERILTFLNPHQEPLGAGYNAIQSKIAIGSGQIWGKGFLEGTQSQLRFLPSKHTDFVFSVFGEEWGFTGCALLLGLFCLFLYQLVVVAGTSKDSFGAYIACGIFFYFFWQILINMGMVLGLMPIVGIPLPFFSYGGSSTLINFILLGLVFNISMRRYVFTQE
jgi:rod shape determining protein RodA